MKAQEIADKFSEKEIQTALEILEGVQNDRTRRDGEEKEESEGSVP